MPHLAKMSSKITRDEPNKARAATMRDPDFTTAASAVNTADMPVAVA